MYVFVESYRAIFLELSAPPWRPLAVLSAVSVAAFVLGHAWFYKLKRSFAGFGLTKAVNRGVTSICALTSEPEG